MSEAKCCCCACRTAFDPVEVSTTRRGGHFLQFPSPWSPCATFLAILEAPPTQILWNRFGWGGTGCCSGKGELGGIACLHLTLADTSARSKAEQQHQILSIVICKMLRAIQESASTYSTGLSKFQHTVAQPWWTTMDDKDGEVHLCTTLCKLLEPFAESQTQLCETLASWK